MPMGKQCHWGRSPEWEAFLGMVSETHWALHARNLKSPQSARELLALQVSGSPAASPEEIPESQIWLIGEGQDPNARSEKT